MKNILYSLIAFLGILMVLPGCKKDEVLFAKPGESRSAFYQDYDAFGPKLEIGVSRALNQFEFKEGVIKMTQEMPMGDFEVLLTDLLARETTDPAKTLRDVLLSAADGVFTANELDDYMAAYPSMILGVRGPVISWALGQHIPPVVFVPSGFEESEQYIQGTRNGRPVEVSLTGQFTEAVVALRLSERHYADGTPAIRVGHDLAKDLEPMRKLGPCDVILTTCPTYAEISILSFNAFPVNGAIALTYQLDIPQGICPGWVKVSVIRENPFTEPTIYTRYGDDIPVFYDHNVADNREYTYVLQIEIMVAEPFGAPHEACQFSQSDPVTVQAEGGFPELTTFTAENVDDNSILFNWEVPNGTSVNEYRIRYRATDGSTGGFQLVNSQPIPGTEESFEWTYPASLQGKLLETVIDYRSAGSWHGTFGHQVLGTHRNPGEPLFLYGLDIANVEELEQNEAGENPINGFPELRIIATQAAPGGSNGQAVVLHHSVEPMTRCYDYVTYNPVSGGILGQGTTDDPFFIQNIIEFPYAFATPRHSEWYSVNGPVSLLGYWDNALAGRIIRVRILETDEMEVNFEDEINTQSYNKQISAKFSFKIFQALTISGGYAYQKTDTETIQISYPNSDLQIVDEYLNYEWPRSLVSPGSVHYGTEGALDLCSYFSGD